MGMDLWTFTTTHAFDAKRRLHEKALSCDCFWEFTPGRPEDAPEPPKLAVFRVLEQLCTRYLIRLLVNSQDSDNSPGDLTVFWGAVTEISQGFHTSSGGFHFSIVDRSCIILNTLFFPGCL